MAPARFLVAVALLAAGCALQPPPLNLPEPLRGPATESATDGEVSFDLKGGGAGAIRQTRVTRAPVAPAPKQTTALVEPKSLPVPPNLKKGEPVTASFEGLPLSAFINEVFGNVLHLPFMIAPELQGKEELVTLRVVDPVSPEQLYRMALRVLVTYGVGAEQEGDMLRFVVAKGVSVSEQPVIVSGMALPSVPVSHRPIFQFVPLRVVRPDRVTRWLKTIFADPKLVVTDEVELNAVVLQGPPDLVRQAGDAIRLLDKPAFQAMQSIRIEPAFWRAKEFSDALSGVLLSEGYNVLVGQAVYNPAVGARQSGSVLIIPVERINSLFVFAADRQTLAHIEEWAKGLDVPLPEQEAKGGLFFYPVKNTMAASIAAVLNEILGGQAAAQAPPEQPKGGGGAESMAGAAAGSRAAAPASAAARGGAGARIVVDSQRNALVFLGTGEEWGRLLPVIKQMDQPVKQVLIEVSIAEVTLSDQTDFGIEWTLKGLGINGLSGKAGTVGGLSIGSKGFNYFLLDDAGQTRAVLNAFASNNRVAVLSSPRLLVRSGEEATINVGTEVPIVASTSTAQDLQTGGTNVVVAQNIQYRKTGVLLTVKPVVHAGGRVDMVVAQEVSKAIPTDSSSIASPSILNRKVDTSLSLVDGGAVLLGGLIANDRTDGNKQIPLLGDIPLLGHLFRTDSNSGSRTELLVFITPYVLEDQHDAEEIAEAFRKQLSIEGGNGLGKGFDAKAARGAKGKAQ